MVNDEIFIAPDAETPPSGVVLTTVVLEDNNGVTDNMLECYGLARTVKLLTIFDIFVSLFYLFYNPYFLIPMVFAFIGYKGASDFNINQIQCYFLFIICFNIFRLISWGFYLYYGDNINSLILGTFLIFIIFMIELWIIRIVYRLSNVLKKLSPIQVDIIKNIDINNYNNIYW